MSTHYSRLALFRLFFFTTCPLSVPFILNNAQYVVLRVVSCLTWPNSLTIACRGQDATPRAYHTDHDHLTLVMASRVVQRVSSWFWKLSEQGPATSTSPTAAVVVVVTRPTDKPVPILISFKSLPCSPSSTPSSGTFTITPLILVPKGYLNVD